MPAFHLPHKQGGINMSEYGGYLTLEQQFDLDRERLEQALEGKLVCGEDEKGFIYYEASEEECQDFLLSIFDNAVYWVAQANESAFILEQILSEDLQLPVEKIWKLYLKHKLKLSEQDKNRKN